MNKSGFEIVYKDGKAGLEDGDGRIISPCIYDKILDYDDDGYIRVLIGNIYGTLDLNGKEVIPHSFGITHLGVFHKGTSRARKKDMWGLVDEKGNSITEFTYKYMGAHRHYGYDVTTKDNVHGILDENGKFTPSKKKANRMPFQKLGTFHDGVAPAYTYENRWIFVDRDYNRVNDYEYSSVTKVPYHALYDVINIDGTYSVTTFDGKPITDDTFDYPLHFEDGPKYFSIDLEIKFGLLSP